MRFLLNVNMPPTLAERLTAIGHTSRHCSKAGLGRASDAVILDAARANGEVVLTHDLDYGHILAFSGEKRPSVIIFRVRNTCPDNLFVRLMAAWEPIEEPLRDGAIVVLEDAALRIRMLPIADREA